MSNKRRFNRLFNQTARALKAVRAAQVFGRLNRLMPYTLPVDNFFRRHINKIRQKDWLKRSKPWPESKPGPAGGDTIKKS